MLRDSPVFRIVCGLFTGVLFLGLLCTVFATTSAVAQHENIPILAVPALILREMKTTEVQPVPAEPPFPAKEETQPYYAEKVVYLTFDDGPDPAVTPLILQTLKQYGVPATFFVVGTQAEASPELVRQIHAEGHAIGNHSYNHRYSDLYRSPAAYIAQLQQCDALIAAITGIKPVVSRAPGGTSGNFTAEYWAALKREGYKDVGWNIVAGDASSAAKAAQIANNVIAQTKKNKFLWSHAVVLMHDGRGHAETAAALPSIIDFFKQAGFEFRSVDRSTPPAW